MKRILSGVIIAFLFCAVATVAFSASAAKTVVRKSPGTPPDRKLIHDCTSCHTLSKEEAGTIFKGLGEVTDVKTSPVKGLFEVTVKQNNRQAVAYLDFSKKLLVPGPIFDIASKQTLSPPPVELPKILSKAEMDTIPLTNSIVMGNPNGKKRIFVFTDPDCPFCGRLHAELKKLIALEPDLAIYIKMYPLDMHPNAFGKARVLLSANSPELVEKAFAGEKLPEPGDKDPKEPVDETIKLGKSLGIDGTPAILLPDGRMISGTRDVKTLRGMLSEGK
jgi:thiol:disulfide interchange protein DsbC